MDQDEFRQFVEKYATRYGKLKPMLDRTALPTEQRVGSMRVPGQVQLQEGQTLDPAVADASGSEQLTSDEIRELNESTVEKVSPRYRKALEAYYRYLSQVNSEPEPEDAAGEAAGE
jgi:hypothetical protein